MGIALELVIGILWLVIILLFVTQVILPYILGTPYFPLFREKTPLKEEVVKTEKELEETTELVVLQGQLNEINRRKAQLEEKS